ncbi:MAG TPA: hypothetical protein VHM48_00170 [Candidatus Limnocylindrales bacterium]|nr:hypothetical protein [Candidatus Limnocylindrales bacterium]
MPIRVEIYGAAGVAVGVVARAGRLREILESGLDLLVERAAWHPLDGSTPRPSDALAIAEDDILVAVADQIEDGPVHAQWHDIGLDVGPYRVTGQMPTMPGFDPGRALARPTGVFVLLRDVRIGLLGDADGPAVAQGAAFVNRYVVDRVAADLMLGFFFPGAEMIVTGGHERSAAGASTAGASTAAASTVDTAPGASGPFAPTSTAAT